MPDDVADAGVRSDASTPRPGDARRPSRNGPELGRAPDPVTSLDDPRVVQILSAEHWSLLSARSLAYNEAFTRGGMFLSFLSFSFVGLALVAQAVPVGPDFLLVAAVVLGFDLVVGLTTYGRIVGANHEDYRAVYGMARIRHGYGEIAPLVLPYFTTSIHDDLPGVMVTYGNPPTTGAGAVVYQLTTSGGMIALIDAMLGGVLALLVGLILGAAVPQAFAIGGAAGLAILVVLAAMTIRFYTGVQAGLEVAYPTPRDETG